MNRTLLLGGLAVSLVFCGCATTSLVEDKQVDAFANCDANWIARVEREARRHGSAIRWYRCPQFIPAKEEPPPFYYGEQRDA